MSPGPSAWIRSTRRAIWLLVFIVLCLGTAWAAAALCIDLRPPSLGWPAAVVYVTVIILVLLFLKIQFGFTGNRLGFVCRRRSLVVLNRAIGRHRLAT
jgi:hypothetical protein